MKFYMEITLLPNPEVGIHFLWSKVYQQIHLGLVEMQDDQGRVPIGVAFPEYVQGDKYSVLGGKLRLFAEHEATLSQFNASHWLARLSDYVHCTSIRPVPEKLNGYAIYQREQPKASKERLARRYAKRHNLSYDAALSCYQPMVQKSMTTPFIRLESLSAGQAFCLWIKKTEVSEPAGATFGSYGLSAVSTVPNF
ncbi:MAG: type I-F CRISPR-associated endoribonuclease Cas6/Csy4 [Methylovulum sp.]|nr:type I-F CRISPR-associated endoribonuclease Cas6/Csy4 [Methylovulum sp.]